MTKSRYYYPNQLKCSRYTWKLIDKISGHYMAFYDESFNCPVLMNHLPIIGSIDWLKKEYKAS